MRIWKQHFSIETLQAAHVDTTVARLDINANHIRSTSSGWVTGVARPVHLGRTTQVWQIDMHNDADELTCVSRITMTILAPRQDAPHAHRIMAALCRN